MESVGVKSDLDLGRCMGMLEPFLPRIAGCVRRGFDKYQEYPTEFRADHDNRAAASCVHAHILTGVSAEFIDVPGAVVLNARGLRVLNIRDRVVGRFKRVNEEGRSRSYPTMQLQKFDKQLPLPAIPTAAARVTFGYEPDLAFSEIIRVVVSCPLGSSILWCAQIEINESGAATWRDITPRRLPGTERYRRYDSNGT
jgi:hypothetical protein